MGVEPTAACAVQPATGFEDRGSHRAPTTPTSDHTRPGDLHRELWEIGDATALTPIDHTAIDQPRQVQKSQRAAWFAADSLVELVCGGAPLGFVEGGEDDARIKSEEETSPRPQMK